MVCRTSFVVGLAVSTGAVLGGAAIALAADVPPPMDEIAQRLKALEFFKDWSNYLLVTTVAALGWLSTTTAAAPSTRRLCIWFFGVSIVFAVFTLALIPLVGEQVPKGTSIYAVKATFRVFWLWGPECGLSLKAVCFPQHVLFLCGIVAYAVGASKTLARL